MLAGEAFEDAMIKLTEADAFMNQSLDEEINDSLYKLSNLTEIGLPHGGMSKRGVLKNKKVL